MSRAAVLQPARALALSGFRLGRRPAAAVAVVALAGLAVTLAFALRSAPGPGVPHPLVGSARVGKLRVSIPRGFHVYTIGGERVVVGPRTPVTGRVLTNFRLPTGTTILDALYQWRLSGSGLPSNGVALNLEKFGQMGPAPGIDDPGQLHLPLSVKQPWFQARSSNGRTDSFRGGTIAFNHEPYAYFVGYWIGPAAPANDRVAILRALRSIRPSHCLGLEGCVFPSAPSPREDTRRDP